MSELVTLDPRLASALRSWRPDIDRFTSQRLVGDASYRVYVRVFLPDRRPASVMAMVLPTDPGKSEEIGTTTAGSELPFIEMADWLRSRGVAVPEVYVYDRSAQVVLLEDLGDTTFERSLSRRPRIEAYRDAVDLLLDFRRKTQQPEATLVAARRHMNRELMGWELDHYVEWRLHHDLQQSLDGGWREALARPFSRLLDALANLPVRLAHRDFQSRNIMETPRGLVLLDFQDALMAPHAYDAVALLRDSYVALTDEELAELLTRFAVGVGDGDPGHGRDAITRAFHLQTLQRKLKDTGRFVFIERVKKNPSFLPYRGPSMGYVAAAVRALSPEFDDLGAMLDELDPDFA